MKHIDFGYSLEPREASIETSLHMKMLTEEALQKLLTFSNQLYHHFRLKY